jgi:hypothetical protein
MVKETFVRYSVQIAEQAKLEGKLEVAKNMLIFGDSPEKVVKITGLSLAKVTALVEGPTALAD